MYDANYQVEFREGSQNQMVYLGLGGNIDNTIVILDMVLDELSSLEAVKRLSVSSYYLTPPVSDIPQQDYVNAVCSFSTRLDALPLLLQLQQIEKRLGKVAKPKNAPRIIDIDMLLYGKETLNNDIIHLPHPRWKERLFVLIPLAEIAPARMQVTKMEWIDIAGLINAFPAVERNQIVRLDHSHHLMRSRHA